MFNKKNEITFISGESSRHLPSPYPAYKKFPEWFVNSNPLIKNTSQQSKCPFMSAMQFNKLSGNFRPSTSEDQYRIVKNSTVKDCPGIVDYLKTGYVLPAWTDFVLRNVKGKLMVDSALETPDMHYGLHRKDQFLGMDASEIPEMSLFHKISSPWWVKTSPGVSLFITHPYWSRNKSFTSVSAVVHTDSSPLHLKWFFELNKTLDPNQEIYDESLQVIPKGTPLALMIPFRRETFTHSIEYLDGDGLNNLRNEDQYKKITWFSESFYDKFRKNLNIMYR
jgi:hypothetical protein